MLFKFFFLSFASRGHVNLNKWDWSLWVFPAILEHDIPEQLQSD